jgi:hypothetical protein
MYRRHAETKTVFGIHRWALALALLCLVAGSATRAAAGTFAVFGPERYVRTEGQPDQFSRTFQASPGGTYTLHIDNGGGSGGSISSAVVTLNGVAVVRTSDFNQNVQMIEKTVTLQVSNQLAVDLRSAPAAGFRLLILGVDEAPPAITAAVAPPPNAAGWNNTDVTVTFQCSDALSGVGFCPPPLTVSTEGSGQVITATAIDQARNRASVSVTLSIDKTPPAVAFSSPAAGGTVNADSLAVAATAADANGLTAAAVNGAGVPLQGGAFAATVALQEGSNTVTATARDVAGNTGSASLQVVRYSLPQVSVTSPASETLTNAPTVQVRGTVSSGVTSVEVNGVPAAVSGTSFTAANVPLFEGNNTLAVVARDARGRAATDSIQVIRDSTAPRVAIHSPVERAATTASAVTVSGMVNDLIIGSLDESEATVRVNGVLATVANRSFVAANVPLSPGLNTITATATDLSGNVGSASIQIRRETPVGQRIDAVSGAFQQGRIGTELAAPLVVGVTSAAGAPQPGVQVVLKVVENNGTLRAAGGGTGNTLLATTDAQGRAQVYWTLGTRAGAGKNRVEATSPGILGIAVFTASGLPSAGSRINLDAGNRQYGVAGQDLPRPLVAVVTDEGHNRLPDVPVTFRVAAGGGRFAGQESVTIDTDAYGRALALLTLGPGGDLEGNIVEADFAGNPGGPAVFVATGQVAGDPAATRISGVVLDNSNNPIAGVTLRVEETALTARTDAQGQFALSGVPVGRVRLIADGSTAERPGHWPSLEYEMVTVAGQENRIGMPVFLLPLDLEHGLFVDETHGGALTLPEIPGFSLTIVPGSATFPGGGKSGVVSVTLVHSDKVPMIPNFGQQPRFVATIQPTGVRFDPPAAMTMPNVDGLAPGEVTEMYSFDHDLGMFVSIGTATVTPDGSLLRSDPGVGVIEGGWHCGGNPSAAGGAASVSVKITTAPKPQKKKLAETQTISASGGPQPGTYSWSTDKPDVISFEGPTSGPNVSSVTIKGNKSGSAKVKVRYTCESGASAEDEITVIVASKDVTVVGWIDRRPIDTALAAIAPSTSFLLKIDLNTPLICNALLIDWTVGLPTDLFGENERRYANAFLLANSANEPPPSTIDPAAVQAGGDYRLFNRLQVGIDNTGGSPQVEYFQSAAVIGRTPDPCGLGGRLLGGPELHPSNGAKGLTSSGSGVYQLNEGRLGSLGQRVNRTINGRSTPYPWSVIRFDLEGVLSPSDPDRNIFPTCYLYEDGKLVRQYPQADAELFIALDEASQRLPGEIP